jgi:ubiquinone/menaquinone biosynthesis C-methylase UbiE
MADSMSYRDEFNKFYSRSEDPYQTGRLLGEKIRLAKTFELVKGRIYKRAVDVGCGEGHFTKLLAKICDEVIGLDVSKVALQRARKRCNNPRIQFLVGTLKQLPFREGSFDLITCLEVIYYLNLKERTMSINELNRVLVKNGFLVISITTARGKNPRTRTPYMTISELKASVADFFMILKSCVTASVFNYKLRNNRMLYELSLRLANIVSPFRASVALLMRKRSASY